MCSALATSQSPPPPPPPALIGSLEEEFSTRLWVCVCVCSPGSSPGSSPDAGRMASAHDRAVLRAIFNPSSPFGSGSGPDKEEEEQDDGESTSPHHVPAFFFSLSLAVYRSSAHSPDLKTSRSWAKENTKQRN